MEEEQERASFSPNSRTVTPTQTFKSNSKCYIRPRHGGNKEQSMTKIRMDRIGNRC